MFGENQFPFHPPGTQGTVDDERRMGRDMERSRRTDGMDRREGEQRGMVGDTRGTAESSFGQQ